MWGIDEEIDAEIKMPEQGTGFSIVRQLI